MTAGIGIGIGHTSLQNGVRCVSSTHPLVLAAPGDAEAAPLVQVVTNNSIQFHSPENAPKTKASHRCSSCNGAG